MTSPALAARPIPHVEEPPISHPHVEEPEPGPGHYRPGVHVPYSGGGDSGDTGGDSGDVTFVIVVVVVIVLIGVVIAVSKKSSGSA